MLHSPAPFLRPAVNKACENQQLSCEGGGCALCLGGCAWMYRSGWWCPACLCTSSQAENQTDTGSAANKPELFLKQHKRRGKRQGDENPFRMN